MRIYILRLRKSQNILWILIFICVIFLYLLVKHKTSILSPDKFEQTPGLSNQPVRNPPIPGKYIEDNVFSNTSYCKFNYNLPEQLLYRDEDLRFSPQLGPNSFYRTLYNVIESQFNETYNSVTYTTHVTPHFVYYLAEIVKYWQGPVSVSAFVPDIDADVTIKLFKNLCLCLPEMRRVSVHFVFPENRLPFVVQHHKGSIETKCRVPDMTDLETFRNRNNLPYPVNVCRNTARQAARTKYVLPSDVELIPSENLATKFARMVQHIRKEVANNIVYVVPVFEVEVGEDIPRNKAELKQLYDREKAFYFHRWVCQHCQKFPGLVKWLHGRQTFRRGKEVLRPFIVARREDPFHRWEPIYIGTNKEPFYSETLSWEGQQDKMTQVNKTELCIVRSRALKRITTNFLFNIYLYYTL